MLNDELTGRQNKKEEIFNKWNSPIFDSYTNPWEKYDLALILENQKLYNEDLSDLPFKQISVPLICKIWKQLSLNDWISVQSMFGVKDYIYYIDDHEMKKEEVSAKEPGLRMPLNASKPLPLFLRMFMTCLMASE